MHQWLVFSSPQGRRSVFLTDEVGRGGRGGAWKRWHIIPPKLLEFRGSEMEFSTFSMRYFIQKNSIWMTCKMTGTSTASFHLVNTFMYFTCVLEQLVSINRIKVNRSSAIHWKLPKKISRGGGAKAPSTPRLCRPWLPPFYILALYFNLLDLP